MTQQGTKKTIVLVELAQCTHKACNEVEVLACCGTLRIWRYNLVEQPKMTHEVNTMSVRAGWVLYGAWWHLVDGIKKVESLSPRTLAHIVRSPVLKEYGLDHPCGPNRRRPASDSCEGLEESLTVSPLWTKESYRHSNARHNLLPTDTPVLIRV